VDILLPDGRTHFPWLISTVLEYTENNGSTTTQSAVVDGVRWYTRYAGYLNDFINSDFPVVAIPYERNKINVTDSEELADAIRIILEAAAVRETVAGYFKTYRRTNGVWTEIEPVEV